MGSWVVYTLSMFVFVVSIVAAPCGIKATGVKQLSHVRLLNDDVPVVVCFMVIATRWEFSTTLSSTHSSE